MKRSSNSERRILKKAKMLWTQKSQIEKNPKIDYDEYFKIDRDKTVKSDGHATCLLCAKRGVTIEISRKSMNTSGLRRHLLAKHNGVVKEK